jgi:hypothetical protein
MFYYYLKELSNKNSKIYKIEFQIINLTFRDNSQVFYSEINSLLAMKATTTVTTTEYYEKKSSSGKLNNNP